MVEAGPALDRVIAERVFGWTGCEPHANRMYGMRPGSSSEASGWGQVPQYSTDIAAAWEVVEWLATEGWILNLCQAADTPHRYWCRFGRYRPALKGQGPGREVSGESSEHTVPEGICRAALAALDAWEEPV